jgi:Na+-transporting methylmalonyl-CoA/oxaloacetate decarboxylase gamma subunit
MIDWGSVKEIAGGGFGTTLLILAILCIVIWLIGLVVRRRARRAKDESK